MLALHSTSGSVARARSRCARWLNGRASDTLLSQQWTQSRQRRTMRTSRRWRSSQTASVSLIMPGSLSGTFSSQSLQVNSLPSCHWQRAACACQTMLDPSFDTEVGQCITCPAAIAQHRTATNARCTLSHMRLLMRCLAPPQACRLTRASLASSRSRRCGLAGAHDVACALPLCAPAAATAAACQSC